MSNHNRDERGEAALNAAVERIQKQESEALAKISQRIQEQETKAVGEILKQSREEIEWVHKAYFFIGAAVALLVAIGIWFTYHAASEWKSDIEKVVTDAEISATNHFAQFESNTVKQLEISSGEITNLILRTFESSNITHIVENVAAVRAATILENKVQPAVDRFTNQFVDIDSRIGNLAKTKEQQDKQIETLNGSLQTSQAIETNLQATLNDAKEALARLDEQSIFITTSILADHDDRKAYEQLVRWSRDPSFKNRDSAAKLSERIRGSFYKYNGPYTLMDWKMVSITNHENWSFDETRAVWKLLTHTHAKAYVEYVWGKTNLTTEQRVDFLRDVYLRDSRNSLYAQNFAAEKVAEYLQTTYNPSFAFDKLENAWVEFSKTNHLFVSKESDPTNLLCEIFFPATDTNRTQVLLEGKDAKLVSFRLRQSAVNKTLEGRFLDVEDGSSLHEVTISPLYKNFVWAWFAKDLNPEASKFEIRYAADLTQTNVENFKIDGNEIIFEDSTRMPLPPL